MATILALTVTEAGSSASAARCRSWSTTPAGRWSRSSAGQGAAPAPGDARVISLAKGGIPGKGLEPAAVPAALDACLTVLDRYGTKTFAEVVGADAAASRPRIEQPWHADLAATLRRLIEAEKGSPGDRSRGLRLVADYFLSRPDRPRASTPGRRDHGGLIRYSDLATHVTRVEEPVAVDYRGYTVYKCGPGPRGHTCSRRCSCWKAST